VGDAEAATRREQYVSRLSEHAQVSRELTGDIVDEVKPTGVRVKPSVQEIHTTLFRTIARS
jgi:hypothetical protein